MFGSRIFQRQVNGMLDTQGYRDWIARRGSGAETTLRVITGSGESNRFQNNCGALSDQRPIPLLSRNVLAHASDPLSLESCTAHPSAGSTRDEEVVGFSRSREFSHGTAMAFHSFMATVEGDWLDGSQEDALLLGGVARETLVFDRDTAGRDVFPGLDAWDVLEFTGTKYLNCAGAMAAHGAGRPGGDPLAPGVTVKFLGADLVTVDKMVTEV